MGAASYYEDIVKRRDEALSQLSQAVQKGRISENDIDTIVQRLKCIVEQEYAKILKMMDIATSPEINLADENNKLKEANATLKAACDRASKEGVAFKKKLDQSDQNAEVLRIRTRRLEQELHELKQRKRTAYQRR